MTGIDLPGSALDVVFTYDDTLVNFSKGKLTRSTRGATQTDYAYERFGRTIRDGGIGYTFDKNGNAVAMTYPEGLVATYTHDYADRPQTLSVVPGEGLAPEEELVTGTPQAIVTAASHRPFGPISSLTLGNGLSETRDYDSRYYPKGILIPGKLDWDYTVDAMGNPTAIADVLAPANNKSYAYQSYQYFLTTGNGPWEREPGPTTKSGTASPKPEARSPTPIPTCPTPPPVVRRRFSRERVHHPVDPWLEGHTLWGAKGRQVEQRAVLRRPSESNRGGIHAGDQLPAFDDGSPWNAAFGDHAYRRYTLEWRHGTVRPQLEWSSGGRSIPAASSSMGRLELDGAKWRA